ncbi:MAG: hypothetical protein QW451_00760 [Candidatus Aenigmatarchaeota archaeon]
MMWSKILGILSFVSGILIVMLFPDIVRYQPEKMGVTGVFIGFALIAFGLYLLKT